jgi:hypothetical protein
MLQKNNFHNHVKRKGSYDADDDDDDDDDDEDLSRRPGK